MIILVLIFFTFAIFIFYYSQKNYNFSHTKYPKIWILWIVFYNSYTKTEKQEPSADGQQIASKLKTTTCCCAINWVNLTRGEYPAVLRADIWKLVMDPWGTKTVNLPSKVQNVFMRILLEAKLLDSLVCLLIGLSYNSPPFFSVLYNEKYRKLYNGWYIIYAVYTEM